MCLLKTGVSNIRNRLRRTLENGCVDIIKSMCREYILIKKTKSVYINKSKADAPSIQTCVYHYFFFFFLVVFFFLTLFLVLFLFLFFFFFNLGLKIAGLTWRPEKRVTARLLLEGLGEALPRFDFEPAGLVELRPEPRYNNKLVLQRPTTPFSEQRTQSF